MIPSTALGMSLTCFCSPTVYRSGCVRGTPPPGWTLATRPASLGRFTPEHRPDVDRDRIPPRHQRRLHAGDGGEARRVPVRKIGRDARARPAYSFDPGLLPETIEHFTGVAQVPIGLPGRSGSTASFAQGDFYVPMATTEGTLVASYNRGMRVLAESGGVTATVVKRSMQRAPVFMFETAAAGTRLRRMGQRRTTT